MDKIKNNEEKKTMPVFVKYGIAALVVIAAIVGGLFIWFNAVGGYVATVGDEKISTGEYKFYLSIQKQAMLYQAQSVDPNLNEDAFWKTEIEGQTAIELAKSRTLKDISEVKVQLAKAKESNVKLTSEETKSIDTYIEENYVNPEQYGSGNRIRANKYFTDAYGWNLDDLRKAQIDNSIVQKYKGKVIGEQKITDEDLKKEYDKDTKLFDVVTVTHVLFLYEGSDGKRSKEDSRKLADETLAKVKAGEDAKELAKKLSEDPGVKDNNGVYTFAKEGQFVPEFEDWAFKANAGDSGIVETDYGYHVMKLDKRENTPFDKAKDKIKSTLSESKYNTDLQSWVKDTKYTVKQNTSVYNSIK